MQLARQRAQNGGGSVLWEPPRVGWAAVLLAHMLVAGQGSRPALGSEPPARLPISVSADEQWVAWQSGYGRIDVAPAAGGTPRSLGAARLFWLPRGGRALILRAPPLPWQTTRQASLLEPATGKETPIPLAVEVDLPFDTLAVSPDATRLAILRAEALHELNSGPPQGRDDALVVQTLTGEVVGRYAGYRPVKPCWSPSGQRLLYIEAHGRDDNRGRPWCLDLTTGRQVSPRPSDSETESRAYETERAWWLDDTSVVWTWLSGICLAPWNTLLAHHLEPAKPYSLSVLDVLPSTGTAWILATKDHAIAAWRYERSSNGRWRRVGGDTAPSAPVPLGLSRSKPGQVLLVRGDQVVREGLPGLALCSTREPPPRARGLR